MDSFTIHAAWSRGFADRCSHRWIALSLVVLGAVLTAVFGLTGPATSSPRVGTRTHTQFGTIEWLYQDCGGALGEPCRLTNGTVTATGPHGTFTTTVQQGDFTLKVPPGRYRLSGWTSMVHSVTGPSISSGSNCGSEDVSVNAGRHVEVTLTCPIP